MPEPEDDDMSPEWIIMEANIREFGNKISMICALEMGDKISAEEAYRLIKETWKQLKVTRKSLVGDQSPPPLR